MHRQAVLLSLLLCAVGLSACEREGATERREAVAGDVTRGRALIGEQECGVCHVIPGVAGARGTVGPSLETFARRNLIAGEIPNTSAMLARWVRDAPSLIPETGMPPTMLSEDEALDVAAYLLQLR